MRTVGLMLTPAPPGLSCPHCGKEYKNGESLSRHIRDKHPEHHGESKQE